MKVRASKDRHVNKEYTKEEVAAALKKLIVVSGINFAPGEAESMAESVTDDNRAALMMMLELADNNPKLGKVIADLQAFRNHEQDIPAIHRACSRMHIPMGALPVISDGKTPCMIIDVMGDNVLVEHLEPGMREIRSLEKMVDQMVVNPRHCNRALNMFDQACIHDDCLELLEGKDCIARGLKPKQMCPSCHDYWHRTVEMEANQSQTGEGTP